VKDTKCLEDILQGQRTVDQETSSQDLPQLHSVEIKEYFSICNNAISNLSLKNFDVEIQYIRRPNMLENIEPRPDIILSAGDILVIIGTQENLNLFEKYTINGE
jgi:CPA2 family monovalent cation:H+ antiporter-2